MFLSTLILTAPIHYRASIAETLMECYISPNLMKKQTHLHQTFTNESSFCRSETVSVPMIPLGLKETKEIDMTVPLQVR